MTVYLVATGCYENHRIADVYATVEGAMQAYPIPPNHQHPVRAPVGWRQDGHLPGNAFWTNGLDWDETVTIEEYEVQGAGVAAAHGLGPGEQGDADRGALETGP